MPGLICPRCGDVCPLSAVFCIECGSALLTPDATRAAVAKIRADGERRRAAANRENRRVARLGVKPGRCRYCGCRCYVGDTCAQHRDLAALEQM